MHRKSNTLKLISEDFQYPKSKILVYVIYNSEISLSLVKQIKYSTLIVTMYYLLHKLF